MKRFESGVQYTLASPENVDEMRTFLYEHGKNQWNHIPEEGVDAEMRAVTEGRAFARLALVDCEIGGFAVAYPGYARFSKLNDPDIPASAVGYIGNVVVDTQHVGKGIGAALLEHVKTDMAGRGMRLVNIDCHEENTASRGMMRKAGFTELAVFEDLNRRFVGSRRTFVGIARLD